MSGLTAAGFERKRLVDIKSDIETALKAAFGDNIDLDPDSKFGEFVGIMSEVISGEWENQEDVYNAMYPSTAQGAALKNVVQFNGIEALSGIKSTVTATVSGVATTVIPSGSKASVTGTGEIFVTLDSVTIPAGGSIDVATASEEEGPIAAGAGTLIVIETPIYGWTGITNASAAKLGQVEETDPELRARRADSTAAGGNNLSDSLAAQLKNLDGVTDAIVINNRTDIVDANGLDPHTFASVLIGGDADEVAAIVWANTPQGIESFGAITTAITDSQGFPQNINYSRAADVDIYFKLDITTNADYPGDDSLKAAIVDYGESNFGIFDDVLLHKFYTALNTIDGIDDAEIFIGLAPSPAGTSNLTINFDEISRYDISRISVV